MLQGLDQVDWENIGVHVYASRPKKEIPNIIRDVLSQDAEIRQQALGFLLGHQQEISSIYDTTPYILPFVIEILKVQSVSGKADILKFLVHKSNLHVHTGGNGELSIHQRRTQIRTYDALQVGISDFLNLLRSDDTTVRKLAAKLLGAMSDDATVIALKLIEAFDNEADEVVKCSIVEAMGSLLSKTDIRQAELRSQYADWFRELVETYPIDNLRVAAARASIISARNSLWNDRLGSNDISPQVGDILVKAYWSMTDDLYERQKIIQLLARLKSAEFLLTILEDPKTTAEEAQVLALGLLWNIFKGSSSDAFFWQWIAIKIAVGSGQLYRMYDVPKPDRDYEKSRWLKVTPTLSRLVAVEKIWHLPTNLFSFFFGLPDSRDELRALIEKS